MKTYTIPVEFKISQDYKVEANSLEEAIEKTKELFELELLETYDDQYVEGSMYIDREYLSKYGERDAKPIYNIGDQVNAAEEALQFIGHNPFGEIIGFDEDYLVVRDIDGDTIYLLPEQVMPVKD